MNQGFTSIPGTLFVITGAVLIALYVSVGLSAQAANPKFYTIVEREFAAPQSVSTFEVQCDVGSKATGGGYNLLVQPELIGLATVYVDEPIMIAGGSVGWRIVLYSGDSTPVPVDVYVSCTRLE